VTAPGGANQDSDTVEPLTVAAGCSGARGGAGTPPTTSITSSDGGLAPAALRARTRRK
jgi:hypothetical protein